MGAYLAMAASTLIAAIIGVLVMDRGIEEATGFGDVVYVRGEYSLDGTLNNVVASLDGQVMLTTADSSLVSLRMQSGALVTLDERTQAFLIGPHELMLQHGRIYVDAEDAADADPALAVRTRHATIVDIGTQFEVVVVADGAREKVSVAVREGRVDVIGDGFTHSAQVRGSTGEELVLLDADLVQRNVVIATATRWDWRSAGRAPFVLTNSSVYEYLTWMARDSGYELQFASRAVEQMSKIGVLQSHGSLTTDETTIEDTLAATRFLIERPKEGLWRVQFRSSS